MLMGPENGLDLWGIDGKGIEQGADRRRFGIGQDGDGELGGGMGEPLKLIVQIAGPLHQHQPGPGLIQGLPQPEGGGGGKVAHPEQNRPAHQSFSSRQAL